MKFQLLMRRKFSVFFTQRFRQEHAAATSYVSRAGQEVGMSSRVSVLDTDESARQLGEQAMIINDLNGFSNLSRSWRRCSVSTASWASFVRHERA